MNKGRFVTGGIAVFIFFFLFQWLFHSVVMSGSYEERLDLLRPESEMGSYTLWMILGFLILAFGFSYVFIKGFEGRGVLEGIRYGLYVGVAFGVSMYLINFAVFPYPGLWVVAWMLGFVIMTIVGGALFAAIYKSVETGRARSDAPSTPIE